jgi:hypothetical protein
MQYTGTDAGTFLVNWSLCMTNPAVGAVVAGAQIFVDGTGDTNTRSFAVVAASGTANLSGTSTVTLTNNQIIDIRTIGTAATMSLFIFQFDINKIL